MSITNNNRQRSIKYSEILAAVPGPVKMGVYGQDERSNNTHTHTDRMIGVIML